MEFKPYAGPALPAPRSVAARTVRKVALCGSHSSSLADAPWDDPTWEFWGHAASRAWYRRQMDRYFDLHPPSCRRPEARGRALYAKWLASNTVPIFMQKKYPEIPASVQYPKGRILTEFSYAHRRQYFANHVAWMIALAITEGVTHIGLFGVNYSAQSEYERQRGSAEYWLGQLDGRGVNLILPEQCSLLAEPALLYGYQSHDADTGLLRAEYKRKEWKAAQTIQPLRPGERRPLAKPPAELLDEIAAEERAHPRPEGCLGPLPGDAIWPYDRLQEQDRPFHGEALVLPDDGRTHQGDGFTARLVAAPPSMTVVPGNGMAHWVGTRTPAPPGNEEA